MSLQTRLRPWHAVMVAVFLVGTVVSLFRAGSYAFADWFEAVLSGLIALVPSQFTVGNLWGYAVEYRNAGGLWTAPVFVVAAGVWFAVGYRRPDA